MKKIKKNINGYLNVHITFYDIKYGNLSDLIFIYKKHNSTL